MKNKTIKNSILLGILVILAVFASHTNAQVLGIYPYQTSFDSSYYNNNIYNGSTTSNFSSQYFPQQQLNYAQEQPYTYVQPQVKYINQPTTTQVQYVPQQQTVQYVQQQPTVKYVNTGSSQGASVINSVSTVTPATGAVYSNTGYKSNTGNYISYEGGNAMGASAYGSNSVQQVVANPTVVDSNGVTALSINGSGSFMPSSVFQWFLLIIIILAIIVVARMIIRKSSNNDPHAAPVH